MSSVSYQIQNKKRQVTHNQVNFCPVKGNNVKTLLSSENNPKYFTAVRANIPCFC